MNLIWTPIRAHKDKIDVHFGLFFVKRTIFYLDVSVAVFVL